MRLDLPSARGSVATGVRELQPLTVAARGGDHGQVLGVDGRAADRKRERRGAERCDAVADARGQDLLELDKRPHGGLRKNVMRNAGLLQNRNTDGNIRNSHEAGENGFGDGRLPNAPR